VRKKASLQLAFYQWTNAQCDVVSTYCKRLHFREDLILANFANCLRFAKNRPREQFGKYVNTTEAIFDSRKLEPANNLKFSALGRFAKI
ncbi:MAG: hypothetical protein PV344_05785, partial [Anaplasma sp.]|nr:hypothetical protein [Anaplasma sp.]